MAVQRDPPRPQQTARAQQDRLDVVGARDQPVGDSGGGPEDDDEVDGLFGDLEQDQG
jgi:hypothetical protein